MNAEFERWSRNFSGSDFLYGVEPGPVARRALRYHRPLCPQGGSALDVGCGEGQDLVYLAAEGYEATGIDFTVTGLNKAQRLLDQKNQSAQLVQADILQWDSAQQFDLVVASNSLQFLGADAPQALRNVMSWVARDGVIGLSMFARDHAEKAAIEGTIYRWTLDELLQEFEGWRPFEAARLWQWIGSKPQPFVTLVAQKLK